MVVSADIYRFPTKKKLTYKISLYNDNEVDAALVCLNIFSLQDLLITRDNLGQIDPKLVLDTINEAKDSWIFSEEFKKILQQILDNVEVQ